MTILGKLQFSFNKEGESINAVFNLTDNSMYRDICVYDELFKNNLFHSSSRPRCYKPYVYNFSSFYNNFNGSFCCTNTDIWIDLMSINDDSDCLTLSNHLNMDDLENFIKGGAI